MKTSIILYGQSLGGAVAIDLASRQPLEISALILENTFTSLPALIPNVLPLLAPLSFLCHQKWESEQKIQRIPRTMPMLLLSGAKDEVVPKEHMQALQKLVYLRVTFKEFPKGRHNDTCIQEGYWTTVVKFVKSLEESASPMRH